MSTSDLGIVALSVIFGFGLYELSRCAIEGYSHRKRLIEYGKQREAEILLEKEQERLLGR